VRSIGLAMVAGLAGAQTQPAGKSVPQPAAVPPSAAPAAKYDTTNSTIGELLDDPAAKAVLTRHIPQLVDKLDQAATRTLKDIQSVMATYSPGILTDEIMAKIDQDRAKLPAKN
jgi:hypothetical protein